MTPLTDAELAALMGAASEVEWNRLCDAIKGEREGQYPTDWWPRVQLPGLAHTVSSRWRKAAP